MGWRGLRVFAFIEFVPPSRKGRENRPQLRCGNTPVQSSIRSRSRGVGAKPISVRRGEGGVEAGRALREVASIRYQVSRHASHGLLLLGHVVLVICEAKRRPRRVKSEHLPRDSSRVGRDSFAHGLREIFIAKMKRGSSTEVGPQVRVQLLLHQDSCSC